MDPSYAVFFPVLELSVENGEHWWCIAFKLKARQIWIIDLYSDPFKEHAAIVAELIITSSYVMLESLCWSTNTSCDVSFNHNQQIRVVDVMVQLNDPQWELGHIQNWAK